jgi:flagellar biosynthesis chaperone FliJ
VTVVRHNPKNKSPRGGTFSITTPPTTNSPQSTINSPRTNHQKTTRKTPEPLENRTLHHKKINLQKSRTQIDSTQDSLRRFPASRVYTYRNMSSSTLSSGITADEFQALEQKVLRAVEIVKKEREARAAAEAEIASLREELATYKQNARAAETELTTLNKEREAVRVRVEKMLQQIDELL